MNADCHGAPEGDRAIETRPATATRFKVFLVAVLPIAAVLVGAGTTARAQQSIATAVATDAAPLLAGQDHTLEGSGAADDDESFDSELDSLLEQDLGALRRTSVAPSLDVEVTSVTRQKSTIGRSPAAVFVITNEMIRRSGYQSIPEVLRLAPGLQVARIDGNKWSISSRGESGRFSDKLLVQIDGRTVYNPLFAGVLWDVQDVLLEDVLRIEVIRGPGATVWGANAVNGVINILTKPSSQTHGSYAIAGAGTLEQGFVGGRLGGRTESGVDYRVWGKWYQRDEMDLVGGTPYDATEQARLGFRTDWNTPADDQITFQGQYYNGQSDSLSDRDFAGRLRFDQPVAGGNLLTRWTRTHSKDHESSLQLYYDRFDRKAYGFGQQTNIFDLDFQSHFRYRCDHAIIWGAGYRAIFDKLTNNEPVPYIAADPERRTVQRFSAFIQDEMTLLEDALYFTLGSKFSHNTFSNFEIQPSARLLWLPSESDAAWCAVSRAIRTPSRLSADGQLIVNQPTPLGNFPLQLFGDGDLGAENLVSYEVGYRQQTNEYLSWDATAYFHDYDKLHALRLNVPTAGVPYLDVWDAASADGYGIEFSATAQLTGCWTVRGWYAFQRIQFDEPSPSIPGTAGKSDALPRNQVSLTHSFDLRRGCQLDLITRYVDSLPAEATPSYLAVDTRLGWNLGRHLSASVVGRNLFDRRHYEFGPNLFTGDVPTEVPRSVHAYVEWRR
ncbi:TonB-dependent receptor plug domain-containing protein [Rhodopirellula sp. JC639]|uniref:TonB-dependent receptor plug domain-containing protein n=1 Tax=Stieleria mannarensis TaxID=2755585 RepID=UPI0016028919